MVLFQVPPPTRYDLRFSIAGIPVRVHPLFWLIALLFGASGDFLQLLIWVIVVFISILIHELGHSFAMRYYGKTSFIVLHFGGGAVEDSVYWRSKWANIPLGPTQQSIIALAGPLSGFFLAALILSMVFLSGGSILITWLLGFIPLPLTAVVPFGGRALSTFINLLLWVNIFWGLINLMPVSPLDGGNVARNILVKYDPWNGARKALWLSVIAGGLIAVIGLFIWRSVYIALLFGFLAFQSYQSLQSRFGSGF